MQCKIASAFVLLVFLTLSPARAQDDPLVDFNKYIHDFNAGLFNGSVDLSWYSDLVDGIPLEVRTGLASFTTTLGEPLTAAGSWLRGDSANANAALTRFYVNLTQGWGGLHDRASELGIRSEALHLGEALCGYGVPDGPYLVIPFYGPATLTDFLGTMLATGAGYLTFGYAFAAYRAGAAIAGGDVLNSPDIRRQAELDYESQRRLYLEQRARICGQSEPALPQTSGTEARVRPISLLLERDGSAQPTPGP